MLMLRTTVDYNLINGAGPYVPDDMDEAPTMRFQVISILPACLPACTLYPLTSVILLWEFNDGLGVYEERVIRKTAILS